MDLGFETIGNATLIVHDRGPLLVTDPWLVGNPYFGSWALSHEIPEEQHDAATQAPFVWISHGHPDHLQAESFASLGAGVVLLGDHRGGRIKAALEAAGHEVRVLPDRRWTPLSDRVRVLCIADHNQDSLLLVDIDGTLVANLNDAQDGSWRPFVRRVAKGFRRSYLLQLSGFGDADMINTFDEDGRRLLGLADRRDPVGAGIGHALDDLGIDAFIPFSSMHRYQRADSVWANEHVTGIDDYGRGFPAGRRRLLSPFVRVDLATGEEEPLSPGEQAIVVRDPGEFGDDWDEPLDGDDRAAISGYFRSIAALERHLDFVTVEVGGDEHVTPLRARGFRTGITFSVPRRSLMTAIEHEIFDDLLIGNFMRTTLHGRHPRTGLYPNFTPYVAKYGDNGRARSSDELQAYLRDYRRRAPLDWFRHRVEARGRDAFRAAVAVDSPLYTAARRLYRLR